MFAAGSCLMTVGFRSGAIERPSEVETDSSAALLLAVSCERVCGNWVWAGIRLSLGVGVGLARLG